MKIRVLSVLAMFLVLGASTASAKTATFHLDETYSLSADGTIYLFSSDADVLIAGSDRSDVHVVVDYARNVSGIGIKGEEEDFEVMVTEENGNLRIREMDGNNYYVGLMVSVQTEYTITIEAPMNAKLQINGDDDEYMIHGFTNGIRLRMEDGRARLREMTGPTFEFETEDGDIELTGGTGLLDVTVEDGSFTVDQGAFSSVTGDVEDGDISIETTLSDDGDYRFRAEDGDITLSILGGGGEFSVYYEDGNIRANGGFDLVDEDENYSQYALPGGSAHVRFRVEDGRVTLRKK